MKEDVLEQVVDDYLKFKGYFTTHNVAFRPRSDHPQYVGSQDSVRSDVDVVGYHPRRSGLDRVMVVSCKAWQGGFDATAKLAELRREKKNPKRDLAALPRTVDSEVERGVPREDLRAHRRARESRLLPSRDRESARPSQAHTAFQKSDPQRGRARDHLPRAAPHLRHAHGGRRGAPADDPALDGSRRREDDPGLCSLPAFGS
jgi:hypothetical protein